MIALPTGRINALRDALGSDFEVDTDILSDAVRHARFANAFYLPLVTKIDFFGRGYEPFDDSEFSRRRPAVVSASGESIVVKSAEDTVLRKLLWFREGGVSTQPWTIQRRFLRPLATAAGRARVPEQGRLETAKTP